MRWLAVAIAALAAGGPPRQSVHVDVWGQPGRSQEVAARPLGSSIAVFRTGRAVPLPQPPRMMRPLSFTAAHLRGDPGALLGGEARRVATAGGVVYLVPTTHGWVCVQGPTFQTCHRGLLREGVTWSFYSTDDGIDVFGIAANDVRAVDLTWGARRRHAELAHNVFFVHRRVAITSIAKLPPLGKLAVSYRGAKPAATVAIR